MGSSPLNALACFAILLTLATGYDVPLEKAMPPLMEPKPQIPKVTHRVYLEVHVAGETDQDAGSTGRIVLGLFGEIAPKTVENFLGLIRCDQGNGALSGKPLCYKGSTFHRIIPRFMIQGGDFTHHDGTGGETIFNGQLLEDETFEVLHNRPYILSMANKGRRNSNGSQFFINTVKTQWLDNKYVGFGQVLDGT